MLDIVHVYVYYSVLKFCLFGIYMYTLFSNNFLRCAIMSYVYFVLCFIWRIKILYIYLSQGTKVKVAKLHENDKKSQTIEIQ